MRYGSRSVAVWWVMFALIVVGGCEKKDDDGGNESGASTAAAEGSGEEETKPGAAPVVQSELTVTHDGKPMEVADAVAYPTTAEARAWRVEVSTHPIECSTSTSYRYKNGEQRFSFDLSPVIEPDGAMPMKVFRTYYEGMNVQGSQVEGLLQKVEITDETVEIDLDALQVKAMRDEPGLTVSGHISARRCPEPKERGGRKPPAPTETDLVIDVEGHRFPIHGVTLEIDKQQRRTLRLSAEPHDCEVWPGGTLALDLRVDDENKPEFLHLRGDVMPTQLNDSTRTLGFTATVPPLAELTGDTATIALTGAHTTLDYDLAIEGSPVTVKVCREE